MEEAGNVQEPPPANQNPAFITDTFSAAVGFLQQYGWFVLFGIVVLIYIKSKLDPHVKKMKKKAEDVIEKKKYDPDTAQQRLEAMERARQKLQEQHDAEAARFAEKQKIKEEEKRKQKIEDWENHQQGKGYRSKVKPGISNYICCHSIKMIRWLKNRKEKREKRRQDKHRRVLNALKARDTTGSTSDYGFYSEEIMQNCESETTPHDYEEINEMSVSNILPQFTKIVGTDFRFGTYITDQPPQLPARGFLNSSRSVSVSSCKDNSAEDKLRARTVSLPSFERPGHFPVLTDADEEPSYHEPWDCKTNLTLKCATENGFNGDSQEVIQLRLYEKVIKRNIAIERKNNSRWSRNSVESQIYSEIEDSDTGCESDTLSQSGSESSVFINLDSRHAKNQKCNTLSNDIDEDYASDSDASSGFCEGLTEIDEDHIKLLNMKCLGNPENAIFSPSLFRRRFNTLPCSPCPKICEDADLYLVPKRRHSLGETTTEKLDLPVQKKKYKMEQRKIGRKNRNRLLEDLIWRNNFKQDVSTL